MDRNREARRASMAATNGLSRRRHRSSSSSFRDSPEEEGHPIEMQETAARSRDRVSKKDRGDRLNRNNKRRRGDRLMHGSNRDEGGEESSEESIDDEEEDEDEDAGGGGPVRMIPHNNNNNNNHASSSSFSNQHQQHHHHHRKSFPPAKVVRPAAPSWKVADEMIGVSVPRKARSASAKRSPECWISGGGGAVGEQIQRQASTSPARQSVAAAAAPSPASISPSSSNVSVRKKTKPIAPKHRPPKMSKPAASTIQEEIEIEVAEVLYGLKRQTQCPSKQEIIANTSQKLDSEDTNGSSNDAKSRVSSRISISPPEAAAQQSMLAQNSTASTTSLPAVAALKRKRPRPEKLEDEAPSIFAVPNSSVSSAAKYESDQSAKMEISSLKIEKASAFTVENCGSSFDLGNFQVAAESSELHSTVKPGSNSILDSRHCTEESESRDGVQTKEELLSLKKESSSCGKLDVNLEDLIATKTISTASEFESQREGKFKIDLMGPPLKSSSERDEDGRVDVVSDPKPKSTDVEFLRKEVKEEEKVECSKQEDGVELVEEKEEAMLEESESQKTIVSKERILDLHLDLEKRDKDPVTSGVSGVKQQHVQKQQPQSKATRTDPKVDKPAQAASVPLPMTLAGWPGSLPPMGYMPPLQGVVTMDGSTGPSTTGQSPHFLLSQPRSKRCATHCYIARNISYHQHFTRMSPLWHAAAGSASPYGAKPYNLNVAPPTETTIVGNPLQGSFPGRSTNSVRDKSSAATTFSGHGGKDKIPLASNFMETARKQLVIQHASQPAAAGNLLHGPAFIIPLNQQQAAAAAATANRSGAVKSTTGSTSLSSATNSIPGAPVSSASNAPVATNVSFNYPNLPSNEAQYLAILQNNGYSFPIPTHVGAPPPYRGGTHAQVMPFFNGSFYSPQIAHPSQLQQQQHQQKMPHSQSQPVQQGHQNTSTSSGSSSSQKHQQNQQQRLQGVGSTGGARSSNNFLASKNRQQQQQQNSHVQSPHQTRQLEAEIGGEDCPSTADSRVSHAQKSVYNQNFAMPIHPQNFPLMSSSALGGGGSGVQGEKQLQQPPQQQGFKAGVELIPAQALAMSFAPFNGATGAHSLDFSSIAQNHAIFQSLPESARHGYHIAAAAAAAQAGQQKKIHQICEEGGKTGGELIIAEDERKAMAGKGPAGIGQSLIFSRPDSNDPSASPVLGNTVIDSSARTLNLISAPVNGNRASRSSISSTTPVTTASAVNTCNSQQQLIQLQKQQQQQQQQQQQMQQQVVAAAAAAAAAARSKSSTASNASAAYSDRMPPSSMAAMFTNVLPIFPQGLIQSSSPCQSSQWKSSVRTTASTVPSSPVSTTSSSLKNLSQQQGRNQQSHNQISFGTNPKSAAATQGQQLAINNQSPSSPVVVGSPPNAAASSMSKSAGGSPRTTSTSNKAGLSSSSSSSQQQANKHTPSGPSRKSSPVGGRNMPSILNNSHITATSSSSSKPQTQQQQQQQQQHLHKQTHQQAQIFFSNTYMQAQSSQSTATTTSTASGYYHQRRQVEHQQQQQQQGSVSTSSSGMLSLCPPSITLTGGPTSDPAKAVAAAAAAANSMKGSMPPPGLLHPAQFAAQSSGNPHQLMSANFPYMHAVPALQVKPAEQKQPAGNDNLHASWQPEKR